MKAARSLLQARRQIINMASSPEQKRAQKTHLYNLQSSRSLSTFLLFPLTNPQPPLHQHPPHNLRNIDRTLPSLESPLINPRLQILRLQSHKRVLTLGRQVRLRHNLSSDIVYGAPGKRVWVALQAVGGVG